MNATRPIFRQRGMMLIEVLVAIVIFSIGVLGMVKMQAISVSNSVNSEDRSTAALLANDAVAMLWASKNVKTVAQFIASTDYTSAWQYEVTHSPLKGVSGTVTVGAASNIAIVKISWTRQMGRNVDFAAASTDPNATATYITQVVLQ